MVRIIKTHVRYTLSELENYTKSKYSCITKVNKCMHISFPPYGLGSVKETLLKVIADKKIGSYDSELNGLILDVRNIKVFNDLGAIRFDDPTIHFNIQADCYVFQPKIGSIVQGLVRHISKKQIGVIIYRVFSVPIRLSEPIDRSTIFLNSEIEFKIKKFDLQDEMPYIEGELFSIEESIERTKRQPEKKTITEEDSSSDSSSESEEETNKKEFEFKRPKIPPETWKAIVETDNEEIEFSDLKYINDDEAKEITKPGRKKKDTKQKLNKNTVSSSDSSEDENELNVQTKHVSFANDSDDDNEETATNENKKSKNQHKSDTESSSSESEANSDRLNIKQEEMSLIKSPNKVNFSDSSDNETKRQKLNPTQSPLKTILKKPPVEINKIEIKDEDSDEEEERPNNEEIKSEVSDNSDADQSPLIQKLDPTRSPLKPILKKPPVEDSDEEEERPKVNNEEIKSEVSDHSDADQSPLIHTQNNDKVKEEIKSESEDENLNGIQSPIEIKKELLTPSKLNGYESEDLFENTQSTMKLNQETPFKKNKNQKKSLQEQMIEAINNKKKSKQITLTQFIPTAHSTQKVHEFEPINNGFSSDSSFSKTYNDIINKTRKDSFSQSDFTSPNISENESKSKKKRATLSSKIDDAIKATLDKAKKQDFNKIPKFNELKSPKKEIFSPKKTNNSAINELLQNTLNKKLLERRLNSANEEEEAQNTSILLKKSSNKKNTLDLSKKMEDLIKDKLERKRNESISEDCSLNSVNISEKSLKKRKRKSGLNESINDAFAKIMQQKKMKTSTT